MVESQQRLSASLIQKVSNVSPSIESSDLNWFLGQLWLGQFDEISVGKTLMDLGLSSVCKAYR